MSTIIQVDDLSPNQTYFFTVTAYNKSKLESDPSNVVQYTVPAETESTTTVTLLAFDENIALAEDASIPITLRAESTSTTTTAGAQTTSRTSSNPLTFQIVTQPTRGILEGTCPNVTYRPLPNFSGTDSFRFTASDGTRTSNPGVVSINVSAVNDPPVASAQSVTVVAGSTVTIVMSASDTEGTPLTYSIVRAVSRGTLSGGTGPSRTYTASASFTGTDTFDFAASDGSAWSAPATVTIQVLPAPNSTPVALAQNLALDQGSSLPITLTGSDADQNPLTFAVSRSPSNGTLSGTPPLLTYTPNPTFSGTDFFEFTANDGKATSPSVKVTLTVKAINHAPVAIAQNLILDQGSSLPITLTGSDVDQNPLTFAVSRSPSNGTLSGTPPLLTYTPNPTFSGTDFFEFTANDGKATSPSVKVTLTVKAINHAPVALAQNLALDQGSSLPITLTGSDVDQNPLTFAVSRPPSNGTLSGTPPLLTYTPNPTFSGTDFFEFTANDGKATSPSVKVTLTVKAINHAPVALAQNLALDQGSSLPITLTGSDVDQNPLTFAVSRPPSNGTLSGTPPLLTYTPNPTFSGTDFFEFTANDGKATSPSVKVTLTVKAINHAPVAIAQNLVLDQGSSLPITLIGSDVDQNPLTFAVSRPPSNGILSGTPPLLTYTPNSTFSGTDFFEFTANDGKLSSAAVKVSLTVVPLSNQPPTADPATFSLAEDSSIYITVTAKDPEGSSLLYEVVTRTTKGELLGIGPKYRYVPFANTNGVDTFTFVVKDGTHTSTAATVTLNITPVNDAPRAISQSVRVLEDTSSLIKLAGTDIDNDTLRAIVVKPPVNGTLTGTSPNQTYTPKADFSGSDSFTFKVNDGTVDSPEVSVSIMISAVNDTPIALAQSVSTTQGTPVNVKLAGTDKESTTLLYRTVRSPSKGTLTGSAPNLTYKPNPGFSGVDSFEFTVYDGALTSTAALVTVSVDDTAPVITPRPDVIFVDASGTTSLLLDGSNSVAANDDAVASTRVQLHAAPRHGTVSLEADGRFQYRHSGGSETEDEFSYVSVTDGAATTPTLVQVHVFQTPDLARQGNQVVLTFPMIQQVVYQVEGNDSAEGLSTGWQVLGTFTTDVAFLAEIPTPTGASGVARSFRIRASSAQGTLVSSTVGFQGFQATAGVRSYASPFQGSLVFRSTVTSAAGDSVALASSDLPAGAWNPSGSLATHALIVAGSSRWWPIVSNESGTVRVDSHGLDLVGSLLPGTAVEVVRLSNAHQILGAPGSADSAITPGDYVDFVSGNGTIMTLECQGTTPATWAYYLRHAGSVVGPVDASSITFLPGQPIQVQKANTAGTLWFLGRVQSNPLTLDGVGTHEANGGDIE